MFSIESYLPALKARHSHLCPRQILGVRIGLAGAAKLGLEVPRSDKRLYIIVETDGCFVSGIEVAAGVGINHRTLRVEDYGKVAATFIDVKFHHAVRIFPKPDIRSRAWEYAPHETCAYDAQLLGYQIMPNEELLSTQDISLNFNLENLISVGGVRTICDNCGEEIINHREVINPFGVFCKTCAGESYYQLEVAHFETLVST
jgi:formylmethanofuran dehydrogenase subunit E